ncbi:MAG: hypothetical protein ACLT98_11805 [Eggerthellaceae bacterium]
MFGKRGIVGFLIIDNGAHLFQMKLMRDSAVLAGPELSQEQSLFHFLQGLIPESSILPRRIPQTAQSASSAPHRIHREKRLKI